MLCPDPTALVDVHFHQSVLVLGSLQGVIRCWDFTFFPSDSDFLPRGRPLSQWRCVRFFFLVVPLIEDSLANGLSLLALQSLICLKVNIMLYSSCLIGKVNVQGLTVFLQRR